MARSLSEPGAQSFTYEIGRNLWRVEYQWPCIISVEVVSLILSVQLESEADDPVYEDKCPGFSRQCKGQPATGDA
jgi:hypothetical protein